MVEVSTAEDKAVAAKASMRIRKLREAWTKVVNDAKGENLRVGAEKKGKLADVTAKAAKLGYPKRSWARMMAIWDHDDAKQALITETLATDDDKFIDGVARIVTDSVDALPLFAAADLAELRARVRAADAGQDESERSARVRAMEEADNVTELKASA
jgi:hypothetical protein